MTYVFQIQNAQAGIGEKFQGKAKDMMVGTVCDSTDSFACTTLDVAINDPSFLQEVVNMVLIFTLVLSLIDSKCEVTEAGKKLKPKSYTAGITHWIHKLAGLIYIYGEIQNIITLRKLDSEYADSTKVDGQLNKAKALLKILEAKKDAAEKKMKILKISNMGFGASAAVDLGLSAAFGAWGAYRQIGEASKCTISQTDLASCAVAGASSAKTAAANTVKVQDMTQACVAKFKSLEMGKVLMNTAKTEVMKTVTKGVGSVVGGALGKMVTKKAGGKKVAQIGGAAVGVYVGRKVSEKVASAITENTDMLKTDGDSVQSLIKEQPKKCIKEGVEKVVDQGVKNLALSAAHDACLASMGTACGATGAASCALKAALNKSDCYCMLRNSVKLGGTVSKMIANLKLGDDLIEDEVLLETLATDANADKSIESLAEAEIGQAPKRDSDEVCGVDYTNWIIRHDLECKSRFDFITEEETEKQVDANTKEVDTSAKKVSEDEPEKEPEAPAQDNEPKVEKKVEEEPEAKQEDNSSQNNDTDCRYFYDEKIGMNRYVCTKKKGSSYLDNFDKSLKKHSKKYARLLELDLEGAEIGLGTSQGDDWVKTIFADPTLNAEYDLMNLEQKEKVKSSMVVLMNALKTIKNNMFFANAYAKSSGNPEKFSSTTNEFTALGGLGIGIVGMFLFPKFIKKGMAMTTVLQRNPMRRGIFYLATYFMAAENAKATKNKIKSIDDNIEQLKEFIAKEEGLSFLYPVNWKLEKLFDFIPNAHANVISNNLIPICVEGEKFSTSCLCKNSNSCGNSITKFSPRSELFTEIPAVKGMASTQLSFTKKMSRGEVRESDWVALENSMQQFAPALNPEIAAQNLDRLFSEHKLSKFDAIKRSKRFMASLQKFGISELEKATKKKIDFNKFKNAGGANFAFPSQNNKNDSTKSQILKKSKKDISNKNAIEPETLPKLEKSKEESLTNFKIDEENIIQNKYLDIFKIINIRYQKAWYYDEIQRDPKESK